MDFVFNFPFISIILSLFSGPLCSVLSGKWAKRINTVVIIMIGILSVFVLAYVGRTGEAFVYRMGHFPAPWGNEIRVGILEAFMACFFCVVMLLCMAAGGREREVQIHENKQNLYYVMVNLLLCSLLALIYTNDLFTAYVFVEINTISACGLIMIRQNGRTIEAATRYMIMSLLGSGLLLLGICFLYDLTGHLLMSNLKEQVHILVETGQYHIPLMVSVGLMSVGLAMKSALYPFHAWLPDAYGYSTLSSAAILSSLVSKGYIFLLIKIFYRVVGFEILTENKVANVLFVFGIVGMIMGSLNAIQEEHITRMIAYSSVAQIGYIYMGIGLATQEGMVASIYHVVSHAATKSLLFVAASGLAAASGGGTRYRDLVGSGYRNKLAGIAFTVGSLSMVGMPMFSGFISKLFFAQAAIGHTHKMLPTFIALALSTVLNAAYFMKMVICIYSPRYGRDEYAIQNLNLVPSKDIEEKRDIVSDKDVVLKEDSISKKVDMQQKNDMDKKVDTAKNVALLCFIILNFVLGLNSEPMIRLIQKGLSMFG